MTTRRIEPDHAREFALHCHPERADRYAVNYLLAQLDQAREQAVELANAGTKLTAEYMRLRHNYGLLLEAHARVQMDSPEDKAMHARVIDVFTKALNPERTS